MAEIREKQKLGKTNLFVTSLCWGCAPLGNIPEDFGYEVPEDRAINTLIKALEGPINFLDTASIYGESELRIGKALKIIGGLPKGFIVATKADRDVKTNRFSAGQIRKSVEKSCERLGMNPLPLVYLHDPEYDSRYRLDKKKAFKEMMARIGPVAELEKLKAEGLILNIGVAGGPIDMSLEFINTGKFDVVITHNRWNLLWQTADSLINRANQMGLGVVNAAPYASGILATGVARDARSTYRVPSKEIIKRVREIEKTCRNHNVPLAAASLQFSLRDHRINSTIVGISKPEQVTETLRLAQLSIPDELWEKLKPFAITRGDPEKEEK